MSIFSKLFGGGAPAATEAEPVEHSGFRIFPEPIKDGSQFRIAARIEKEIGGETRTHQLIRADTLGDHDAAVEATIGKAKVLIDQQGERIFE